MAEQQSTERNRGENLKNAIATGAVFGIFLPLVITTYVAPRLIGEGMSKVGHGLAEMVGKRKK